MNTISRQGMSLLSSVPVLYAYMNMHTSYTLTHTCANRCTSTHTIIHTSKNIYTNAHKHVSTPTHIPAHKYSCTHIRAHYLNTLVRER